MPKYDDLSLLSPFPFGKYQGWPVISILDNEPEYVRWLVREAIVVFNNEAWEYFTRKHGGQE